MKYWRVWVIALLGIVGMLLVCSCTTVTPRQTLAGAEEAYLQAVTTVTLYAQQGIIDKVTAKTALKYAEAANTALELWSSTVRAGKDPATAIADFQAAYRQLILVKAKAEVDKP